MLILSRRAGDAIVIDGGIRIVVVACDRRGVRLGIEAPEHVSIVREEIVAQVADENRRATAPRPPEWLQLPLVARPRRQHDDPPAVAPPTSTVPRQLSSAQERRRPRR